MKQFGFCLVLFISLPALAIQSNPDLMNACSKNGEIEIAHIDFRSPIPVEDAESELIRLGYFRLPFSVWREKTPLMEEYATGLFPEADCPVAVAITPSGDRAVMAFRLSNNVGVQNLANFSWEQLIAVGGSPVNVAITPSGDYSLVVCLDDDRIDAINLTTYTVDHQIPVGQGPVAIAIADDGNRAIVLNSTDSSASIISLNTWTVERTVEGIVSGVWTTMWSTMGRWLQEYSEVSILNDSNTAVAPTGSTVEFIDMTTGVVTTLNIDQGTAKDMDITRDGAKMAVAGDNATRDVNFIDLTHNPPVVTGGFNLNNHFYSSAAVKFNQNGSLLALTQLPTTGGYTYLSFFDASTYAQYLYENSGASAGMALSPDGETFLSVGYRAVFVDLAGGFPIVLSSILANNMEFMEASSVAPIAVAGALIRDEASAVYDYSAAVHDQLYYGSPGIMPEGDGPRHIVMSDNGVAAMTADYVSDGVTLIDAQTGLVRNCIPTGNNTYYVGISPDGSTGIACNYESMNVSIIDVADESIWTTLPSKTRPGNCAVSPDGQRAYVVCAADNPNDFMSVYDLAGAGSAHVTDLDLGLNIYGFGGGLWVPNPAISSNGSTVVVPGANPTPAIKSAIVIDTNLLSIQATVNLSASNGTPYFAAISPDSSRAIILNSTGSPTNTISVIHLAGPVSHVEASLSVTGAPGKVVYSEDGDYAYFYYSNYSPATRAIGVIDTSINAIVHTVNLPGDPSDMSQYDGVLYTVCEVNPPTLLNPAIVLVSMAGVDSAITGTYYKDFYSSSIGARGDPLSCMTVNCGWDMISWLHDEPTPTPLPVPCTGSAGNGILVITISAVLMAFTWRAASRS